MLPHIKGKTISIKSINCNFSGKWKTKRLTKNREKAKEFITKKHKYTRKHNVIKSI